MILNGLNPRLYSGLYSGVVVHNRYGPKAHHLSYRIFQILYDLEHLDQLKQTRYLSHNRFNLFGFYDRDHGPTGGDLSQSLFERMRAWLMTQGAYRAGDRLFIMTMPRVLGFVFNPISLYFVQAGDGEIHHMVYQVNNTFGERHFYVLKVNQSHEMTIKQGCEKRLHVSPFMDTKNMVYDFKLTLPGNSFSLGIKLRHHDETAPILYAGFKARRLDLTPKTLWAQFWALPLMTLKVVVGIHWEAVRLIVKGLWLKPNLHLTKVPNRQTY